MGVARRSYPVKKLCEREFGRIRAKHEVYNKNRVKTKKNNKKLTLASGN